MTGGLRRSFVTLWLVTLASVPLSLRWAVSSGGMVVAVPLELLVAVCAVILMLAWVSGRGPEGSLLLHPVSLVVVAGLAWTLVTSMTSVDPGVSLKYALARAAYVAAFFGGGLVFFSRGSAGNPPRSENCEEVRDVASEGRRRSPSTSRTYGGADRDPLGDASPGVGVASFAICSRVRASGRASRLRAGTVAVVSAGLAGFLPVVGWTVWRHAPSGFVLKTSVEIGRPFYPNHLEYGATLVFWLLVLVGLALAHRARTGRLGSVALILALGFLLPSWAAHSRSAWLALIAGLAVIIFQRFAVGLRGVMITGTLVLAVFFGLFAVYFAGGWPDTGVAIGEGVQEPGPFENPSLNERLNRWSCAVRMAGERPLVGFGPGTYEGSYGVFQDHREMTSHSSLKGSRGDAHSEFFSCLAEQGVVGLLMVVLLFATAIATGLKAVAGSRDGPQRCVALGWTAALISLAVGNLFNAYFEVDRVAPLLWLACAALVVMERDCGATSQGNR